MIFELIVIVLISLAFGSFANNVISYYINSSEFDLVHSTCFCGKKRLEWFELIPVLSYFLQKGKCTECSEKISIRYPLVEVLTLIIALLVFQFFGLEIKSSLIFFILYLLMMISVIDYYSLIIPNLLVIALLLLISTLLIIDSELILIRIAISISITFVLVGLQYFFKQFKNKDVLGIGDIKLIFALSLLLNITDSMIAIWLSSLLGLLVVYTINAKDLSRIRTTKIPFGLYLSIGFTIVFLWNLNTDNNGLESLITSLWQMK
jgi:leader peptidase (prepilin peptidase)/N-methyltransferase